MEHDETLMKKQRQHGIIKKIFKRYDAVISFLLIISWVLNAANGDIIDASKENEQSPWTWTEKKSIQY